MTDLFSDNLTPEAIKGTHYSTEDIIAVLKSIQAQGITGMNLKLLIDLLSDVQKDKEDIK